MAAVVIAAAVALVLSRGTAHGAGFTVNVLFDESDSNPGDGFCRGIITPNVCTLRAAIQGGERPGRRRYDLAARRYLHTDGFPRREI